MNMLFTILGVAGGRAYQVYYSANIARQQVTSPHYRCTCMPCLSCKDALSCLNTYPVSTFVWVGVLHPHAEAVAPHCLAL